MHTKTLSKISLLAGTFVAALTMSAETQNASEQVQPVTVVFENAENFTDAKNSSLKTDSFHEYLREELTEALNEIAESRLTAGQRLEIVFHDIDMAGEIDPMNRGNDIRVIKDIFIPRLDLTYKLVAADGSVVKTAREQISEMNFMVKFSHRAQFSSTDLPYEKGLISDWFTTTFPKVN